MDKRRDPEAGSSQERTARRRTSEAGTGTGRGMAAGTGRTSAQGRPGRPAAKGARPARGQSTSGRAAAGRGSASGRPFEGYPETPVDDEAEIERLLEEKYREIEYLEAQSRRKAAAEGLERQSREERESRRRPPRSGRPAGISEREEEDWDDSMRSKKKNASKRAGRDTGKRSGKTSGRKRSGRDEEDEEDEVEKPFFSERIIKFIGGIIGLIIVLLVIFVVFGQNLLSGLIGGGSDAHLASGEGVLNILLVGQDAREDVEGSRSDSMMLVSVDKSTSQVKIISLMRDMYVSIPGHDKNRINAAYSFGGVDLLEETIEENFLVKIDGNVQIDFESFKTIVDKVGGVEIELSQAEADYLNTAYWQNGWSLGAGVQTLDGDQALAYSRIRQVGNSDFERTERQRKVLMTVFRKVKGQGKLAMLSLAKDIYPMLDTDIGMGDMISLGTTALGLDEENITTYRLPVDGGYENQTISGMEVLVPNMEKNQAYLQELLFGTSGTTE